MGVLSTTPICRFGETRNGGADVTLKPARRLCPFLVPTNELHWTRRCGNGMGKWRRRQGATVLETDTCRNGPGRVALRPGSASSLIPSLGGSSPRPISDILR